MVVYIKCNSCQTADKILYARLKSAGHDVRIVKDNIENKKEAEGYNFPLPFGVKNGKAIPISKVLK